MRVRILPVIVGVSLLSAVMIAPASGLAAPSGARSGLPLQLTGEVAHDTSPPLRDIAPIGPTPKTRKDTTTKPSIPGTRIAAMHASAQGASAVEVAAGAQSVVPMPTTIQNFAGMDNPNGYYPPDTVGDVSLSHYVEMVNVAFAIYDKAGTKLYGPADFNTLFTGFGGACETENSGDPIVMYDGLADRWVLTQFGVPDGGEQYECLAVSTTSDPLGTYYRYAFSYGTLMPDYPKLSVWPDGYYATYNMFDPADNWNFAGTKVCALERSRMLVGAAASQQCFDLPEEWSMLPSDVDGATPPPAGSPNYLLAENWSDQDKLTMYRFHTDWNEPGLTQLEGPIYIDVDPFAWACVDVYRGQCVPQPDTGVQLESLGGRMMYRLAYRNFGDHEALVANHTVATDGNTGATAQTGIAWYEIRSPGQTPVVHQQGTSADADGSTFQWMASLAMDRQGNIGMGYSTGSATKYPSINYNGRLAADPVGTFPYAEGTIKAGGGSQTGLAARWGDYSAMQVDPEDDCTFWYTNEYLSVTGRVAWQTQIASFKYPGCVGSTARPGAPARVTAAPGNARATVAWAEPGNTGGLPITGYNLTSTPGGATCTTLVGVDADPLTCTVTGLTNGQSYAFSVTARNGKGAGPGTTSAAVVPSDGTPTPAPEPTTAPTPAPKPTPTPDPSPGPVAPTPLPSPTAAPLRVSTGGATTVLPGARVPVTVGAGAPGCSVRVSLGTSARTATVDPAGAAAVTLVAPKPNRPDRVTAVQTGTGCPAQAGEAPITVKGPYLVGPSRVKAGRVATLRGLAFAPDRAVTWKVIRNGATIDTARAAVSARGVSTYRVVLAEPGRYTLVATQGRLRAQAPVLVR